MGIQNYSQARARRKVQRASTILRCEICLLAIPLVFCFRQSAGRHWYQFAVQNNHAMVGAILLSFVVSAIGFYRLLRLMLDMLRSPGAAVLKQMRCLPYMVLTWAPMLTFGFWYLRLLLRGHQQSDLHVLYGSLLFGIVLWCLIPWKRILLHLTDAYGLTA